MTCDRAQKSGGHADLAHTFQKAHTFEKTSMDAAPHPHCSLCQQAHTHTHTNTHTHTHTHIRTHMHAYQLRERRTHLSMSLPPCLPRPFPPSPLSPPLSLPVFPFLAHGMTGGWHTNMRALTQTRTIMTANTYDNALANTYSNDGKHVR